MKGGGHQAQERQKGSGAQSQSTDSATRPRASQTCCFLYCRLCDPGEARQHLCAPVSTPLDVSDNSTSSSQASYEN